MSMTSLACNTRASQLPAAIQPDLYKEDAAARAIQALSYVPQAIATPTFAEDERDATRKLQGFVAETG
eukprot:6238202-Prorocentrum_lima.AAC.1